MTGILVCVLYRKLALLLNLGHFLAEVGDFVCAIHLLLFDVLKTPFDAVHVVFYFTFFKHEFALEGLLEPTVNVV